MSGDVLLFKGYLRWLLKHGRIKKLSAIESYWKQISMLYNATTNAWMDAKILLEMHNVRTTLCL